MTLALAGVASFHLAYQFPVLSWLMVVFLCCVFQLCKLRSARRAIWIGMLVGLACYAPRLAFFWTLFGAAAVALWCVLSFWLALFIFLGRACQVRLGPKIWALLAPFTWTGLEYFRSELYYLRFSWLSPGYAFSESPFLPYAAGFGTYGIGFLLMGWVAYFSTARLLSRAAGITFGVLLGLLSALPFCLAPFVSADQGHVNLAGMQLEGSSAPQVLRGLDSLLKNHPDTDLFVLSELTFEGPVPKEINQWCQQHKKYLAVGGEDPIKGEKAFYNTVFVIGPDGSVVFQQGKCVPVQFLNDGQPASEQRVWNSPWGKLGFGICYDASYTRVTDELERLGAQALIFPTMDVTEWGEAQHKLHARIAPMRAAEYGLPFFRLCSSGISQFIGRDGRVLASAPFGGQGKMLAAQMKLAGGGRMPVDRPLAQMAVAIAGALLLFLILEPIIGLQKRR